MRKETAATVGGVVLALTVCCGGGAIAVDAKLGNISNVAIHLLEPGFEAEIDFDSELQGHCHAGLHNAKWYPHLWCRSGLELP